MTQISSDYLNQQSSLNEKKISSRDISLIDSNKSISIYKIKNQKISSIFNRYAYSSIFENREKNLKNKKLNLKLRNSSFSVKK